MLVRRPIAVAYSRTILGDRTAVVQADLRRPDQALNAPEVQSLLDLDRPVAVMMVAVLHFVPDSDDPAGSSPAIATRTADLRARARRRLGQDPPAGGWPAPTPRKWRPDRAERLERVERMLYANTFTSAYRELDQWQADTTNDQELAEIDALRAEAGRRAEQYRIKSRRESSTCV